MQKNLGPLGQIGYVVSDLKEAAMEWVDTVSYTHLRANETLRYVGCGGIL